MPSTRGMDVELSSETVNAELAQWYGIFILDTHKEHKIIIL